MASDDEIRVISGEEFEQKKVPLFSEEEEIIVLQELQTFRNQFGPKNDWKRFHDASQLKDKFGNRQLSEKLRRLRDRFEKNRTSPPASNDPHKLLVFNLCKSLWGANQDKAVEEYKPKPKPKPEANSEEEFPKLMELFSDGSIPELLRRNWGLIGAEAAEKFEERAKILMKEQLRLVLERTHIKHELCEMVAEIMNPPPPPMAIAVVDWKDTSYDIG